MRKYYLLVVLLLAVLSVNSQSSYAFDAIPIPLLKNANAIIRDQNISIQIVAFDKMKIKIKKAITIKNKLGDRYNSVRVHYNQC